MTDDKVVALRVALSMLRELLEKGIISIADYEIMKAFFIEKYRFTPRTIFA